MPLTVKEPVFWGSWVYGFTGLWGEGFGAHFEALPGMFLGFSPFLVWVGVCVYPEAP